jgi:glycosyltransferase involved in cell wall biosynthesis
MKVLLVAPHYPPQFIGGVELCTERLAHRLRAAGHETSVVAVERVGADQAERLQIESTDEDGVAVFRLSLAAADQAHAFSYSYRHPDVETWLEGWLRRERPDVVHLHSGYLLGGAVLSAAAKQRVPAVVTLHDFWFICPRITMLHPNRVCCTGPESPAKCAWCLATERRRYRLPARWLGPRQAFRVGRVLATPVFARVSELPRRAEEIASRRRQVLGALAGASAIVSPSRFVRDQMIGAGVAADRIELIPNGTERRKPAARRSADALALRVGFLGQIAPHKGLHVLIDAVRRSPRANIELLVHGSLTREADYVRRLRAQAGHDPRIVFAGSLERKDLDAFFARIDILAVPSVWYENSPLVIHEARFAGLPILASRLGGMTELVEDGVDGLLADAGSPSSFARQFDRLMLEPGLLDRLRAGVRPPPTLEDEVGALLSIYRRVVAESA